MNNDRGENVCFVLCPQQHTFEYGLQRMLSWVVEVWLQGNGIWERIIELVRNRINLKVETQATKSLNKHRSKTFEVDDISLSQTLNLVANVKPLLVSKVAVPYMRSILGGDINLYYKMLLKMRQKQAGWKSGVKGFNRRERNNPPRSSRAILTERRQILTEVSFPPLCWPQG